MARRFLTLISAALLLAGSGAQCWCQSARASMLSQVIQADGAQLGRQVRFLLTSSPDEARLLGLDLITYRWAVRASGAVPDVKNIDSIIKAIDEQSADPTLRWAQETFLSSGATARTGPPPPANDPRGPRLVEFLDRFSTAMEYEESGPNDAIDALKAAQTICLDLRLELTGAQTASQLGDYYLYRTSQFQLAERCYTGATGAIWVFTTYGCVASTAKLLDSYGLLNMTMGRYATATDNHRQAAQQWLLLARQEPQNYRYHSLAGQQYMMAGEALIRQGETDKGLEMMTAYGLEEIKIWAHATKSYEILIDKLVSVAGIQRDQAKTAEALELLEWAERDADASGNPLLRARTYQELAKTYSATGNQAAAEEMTRNAARILNAATSIGKSAVAKLGKYPDVGKDRRDDLLRKAGWAAAAYSLLEDLDKSAGVWRELASIQQRYGLVEESVQSLRSLAAIYEDRLQWNECLVARLEAAKLARKANKLTLTASIVEDMVDACSRSHDLQNMLEVLAEFVPILEASHDTRRTAAVMAKRGALLAENGQPDKAINDFANARARYLSIGDSWAAGGVTLKLAAAQSSANKPEEARSALDSALRDVEKFAYESLGRDVDPGHADILLGLYRELTSLDITAGRLDEAEALLKRAINYRWFSDLTGQLEKSSNASVVKYVTEFDFLNAQEPGNDGPDANHQALLADNWGAFSVTCRMLREQDPAAYDALPTNPLDIYALRWKLPSEAAIITYLVTESGVYAFLCGRDQALCWELGTSSVAIGASVAELRNVLVGCEKKLDQGLPVPPVTDWGSPAAAEIRKPLADLHGQLLAPLTTDFAAKSLLVFALPRELTGLPMHALVGNGQDASPRFLIQDHAVTYLSEGMLDSLISRDGAGINPQSDSLAILADPEGKLPGALKEASAIAGVYANSKSFVGAKATASRLISESQTAHILHIATHHLTNPNATKFTLVLAPDGSASGSLDAQALAKIKNDNLKLVVLSACDTISSADPISNGASCVAEMFSRAGAQSVMGGLWRVRDDSAAGFMTDFYRQLGQGSTKAEAIRYAQSRMIASNTYAHPFYWACFALYGNPW